MIVSIPVYDEVDLLDVAGPHEVLKWLPDVEVRLVAGSANMQIVTRDGFRFLTTHCFSNDPIDVLWVPGGNPGAMAPIMNGRGDGRYLRYLKQTAERATWVCSVCEGALLLAAAGLLDGYEATTHWNFIPCLKAFGPVKVVPGFPRFHRDRNRLTGGGISSGLDESLELVRLLKGEDVARDVQRVLQYYPVSPYPSDLQEPPKCMFDFS